MTYEVALSKAWSELSNLTNDKSLSVRFLADEYSVNLENRGVLSLSCNVPAKEYLSILILHYLIQKFKGLPSLSGEWITFRQLEGGQGYYPTFKKRVIGTIARKYSANPDALLELTKRFKAQKADLADVSVVLEIFEKVPMLIELWRADEEFGTEVNVLFDRSIKDIFSTEDIVVLAEFVAHNI
ncbi:MAG: DUF3786 domain-containing protein [Candidatus Omnitrophica bacterium]|nr:DUF3786 domain-containing protein [Candidatus Omnitrophota bacterium]MDD5352960.1 DUF3786 domain-containing protein [Candidatus Omnitrophota bacterium]MDD5550559.1 DUF3786 domain-containing protein [Candidatus Omnitrophota bacterium]